MAREILLGVNGCQVTYNVLVVMAADEVAHAFATLALVGMVALQAPLGGAGEGQKAENDKGLELHVC
jgi:hypothetical protein